MGGFSADDPKKGQEFFNFRHFCLHHFIYSKKRLGLQRNLTVSQGTRKRFGALRCWGEERGFGDLCVPLEKSWLRSGKLVFFSETIVVILNAVLRKMHLLSQGAVTYKRFLCPWDPCT